MQALPKIDLGATAPEPVVPAKSSEPKSQEFGKVLNGQQAERQPQQQTQPTVAKSNQTASAPAETKQNIQTANQEQTAEPQTQATAEAQTPSGEVQQLLMSLLKSLIGKELPDNELITGNQMALEELSSLEGATTEELLSQLVQQLEASDLSGEQMLTTDDLATLIDQLQSMTKNENGEELLSQLVSQLNELLGDENNLLEKAEMIAGTMPGVEVQKIVPSIKESLVQVRQILQKALGAIDQQNNVADKNLAMPVAEEQSLNQDLLTEEASEKIDPRFAGLIKPRSENRQNQESLRQRVRGDNAKPVTIQLNGQQNQSGEADPAATETKPVQANVAEFADLLGKNPKQMMENLVQQAQGNIQQANQGLANARPTPDAARMLQMPSGQQVAESQVFDQVVARMSGSFNGESGRMVLRLHPAELGSLKLELIVEGNKVRAQLQAQTTQVQEVLERNLPQLRNALAEQGLKIDEFKVDVDQQQDGRSEDLAKQQRENGSQQQPRWRQDQQEEEQIIPLSHLMQNGGGGISLHV